MRAVCQPPASIASVVDAPASGELAGEPDPPAVWAGQALLRLLDAGGSGGFGED